MPASVKIAPRLYYVKKWQLLAEYYETIAVLKGK